MTTEQSEKLENLRGRIIALLPKWKGYAVLMAFLEKITRCKDEDEIDAEIKTLEFLVRQAKSFVEDKEAYIQKHKKILVQKKEPPGKKPAGKTVKRKSGGGRGGH